MSSYAPGVWVGDDEPVHALGLDPRLHLVGDFGARADEAGALAAGARWPARSASVTVSPPMRAQGSHQLADPGHRTDELVGDGVVQLHAGEVVVHELREQRERRLRVYEGVEEEVLVLLGVGVDSPTTV